MTSFPPTPGLTLNLESPYRSASHPANHGLRHATIRQVLNAVHVRNHFEIDGRETEFIAVIANVYDVGYRGGKLDYGLDDGTGRIKAYQWDIDGQDAERELAEYESQNFSYVRAIGKISEYNGLYSIHLTKINVVEDPHEIYHHLLGVIVESLVFQRGPPSRALMASVSQGHVKNQHPEALSMHTLQNDLPDIPHPNSTHQPMDAIPQPTPSPKSDDPQTPEQIPRATSRVQQSSESPPESPLRSSPMEIDDSSHRRNYRIGGDFSLAGPSRKPGFSPSPVPKRYREPSRPSLASNRLLRNSNRPSTASTAIVTQYQASPEFISPTSSPKSSTTPRNARSRREPGNSSSEMPQVAKPTDRMVPRRRDPYSHLSNLQRDIILTIQNMQNSSSVTGDDWEGASITILVQTIARRRPSLTEDEFGGAFTSLIDEGYIYSTIDESHFACT